MHESARERMKRSRYALTGEMMIKMDSPMRGKILDASVLVVTLSSTQRRLRPALMGEIMMVTAT